VVLSTTLHAKNDRHLSNTTLCFGCIEQRLEVVAR